jgi:hypothetical protein
VRDPSRVRVAGPLEPYVEGFGGELVALGYRPDTAAQPGSRAAGQPGSRAAGQRMLAGTARLPPWWRRIGSITCRSPTVHAVGGSFIHRSPATEWRRRG